MYFCCVLVLWNENMLNRHSYAKQTITLTCNVIKVVMLKETDFTLCWMFLQVQSVAPLSTFGVKFHKCARVHQQFSLNTERIIFSWTNFEHKTTSDIYFSLSIVWSTGEAGHWSSSADILPADSQHGPSGWHQPVSGGYSGLHLWNSTPKNWRQGGGKRLPDVCHWFTVWYVWESECFKRWFYQTCLV